MYFVIFCFYVAPALLFFTVHFCTLGTSFFVALLFVLCMHSIWEIHNEMVCKVHQVSTLCKLPLYTSKTNNFWFSLLPSTLEMRIYYLLHKQSLEISYLPFLKSYWLSKVFLKYPLALSLTVGPAPQWRHFFASWPLQTDCNMATGFGNSRGYLAEYWLDVFLQLLALCL